MSKQVEAWLFDGVCEATDGETVEPDGTIAGRRPELVARPRAGLTPGGAAFLPRKLKQPS